MRKATYRRKGLFGADGSGGFESVPPTVGSGGSRQASILQEQQLRVHTSILKQEAESLFEMPKVF